MRRLNDLVLAAGPGAVGSRGCERHPCHDPCHAGCHEVCLIQKAGGCGRDGRGQERRGWSGLLRGCDLGTHGEMIHVERSHWGCAPQARAGALKCGRRRAKLRVPRWSDGAA